MYNILYTIHGRGEKRPIFARNMFTKSQNERDSKVPSTQYGPLEELMTKTKGKRKKNSMPNPDQNKCRLLLICKLHKVSPPVIDWLHVWCTDTCIHTLFLIAKG